MLKIGEFAQLSQVSLKTLRHYDQLGVLRPAKLDPESGYRLYDIGQLADMMRILALKDCGCTLEEIAHLLRTSDVKAVEILLNERVIAQQQRVAEEQVRLQRLLARVKQLALTQQVLPYDVVLKRTKPLTLLGLRRRVATTQDIGPFVRTVVQRFEQQGVICVGPLVHLYFGRSGLDEELDLFVGAPVAAFPSTPTDLRWERLPEGGQVACVLYRGDYPGIGTAYTALDHWLLACGYHAGKPVREIHYRSPAHTADPSTYLTEIHCPLEEQDP